MRRIKSLLITPKLLVAALALTAVNAFAMPNSEPNGEVFKLNDGYMASTLTVSKTGKNVTVTFDGFNSEKHTCSMGPVILEPTDEWYSNSKIYLKHVSSRLWVVMTKEGWE